MLKNILAAIVGLLAGGTVVMLAQMLGHMLFPLPFELDMTEPESMKNTLALNADMIPLGTLMAVVIAHFLGALFGAFITCRIARTSLIPAYVVIGLLAIFTVMNFIEIPTPGWVMVVDVLGVLLGGYLGIKWGSHARPQPINPHLESR